MFLLEESQFVFFIFFGFQSLQFEEPDRSISTKLVQFFSLLHKGIEAMALLIWYFVILLKRSRFPFVRSVFITNPQPFHQNVLFPYLKTIKHFANWFRNSATLFLWDIKSSSLTRNWIDSWWMIFSGNNLRWRDIFIKRSEESFSFVCIAERSFKGDNVLNFKEGTKRIE